MATSVFNKQMNEEWIYKDPQGLFEWAKEKFDALKGKVDPTIFAIFLPENFDPKNVPDPDEVYTKIVNYAKEMGIEPLPNYIGARLEASTCLKQFLERPLPKVE